jgi:hypothetical protein
MVSIYCVTIYSGVWSEDAVSMIGHPAAWRAKKLDDGIYCMMGRAGGEPVRRASRARLQFEHLYRQ